MGVIYHHAIVITDYCEAINEAMAKAVALGCEVLGPSAETINGYRTILICPDGSKEGRDESKNGDKKRKQIVAWLEAHEFGYWVEVGFGDYEAKVLGAS